MKAAGRIARLFVGQKTIDQVIKIINDRAQTYVSERG